MTILGFESHEIIQVLVKLSERPLETRIVQRLRSSFLYLHMDNAKISLSKLRMGYFYVVIDSYIF